MAAAKGGGAKGKGDVSDAVKIESLEAELQEMDEVCGKLEKRLEKRDKAIATLKQQLQQAEGKVCLNCNLRIS